MKTSKSILSLTGLAALALTGCTSPLPAGVTISSDLRTYAFISTTPIVPSTSNASVISAATPAAK